MIKCKEFYNFLIKSKINFFTGVPDSLLKDICAYISDNAPTKNNIIALKEFRLNAQKYIDASAKGNSFIVVKRSHPVFRIEPMEEEWETIADFSSLPCGGIFQVLIKKNLS